jgi:hypothetical protein
MADTASRVQDMNTYAAWEASGSILWRCILPETRVEVWV